MRLTERKYGEIVSSKREKEPIQCSTFCNNCSQGTGNCNYVKEMVEKLVDYEDAEEQGLLLRLKLKVGDTVWSTDFGRPCSYVIAGYSFGTVDFWDEPLTEEEVVYYYSNSSGSITGSFAESEIGKTVFLTREEAEAVLAEKGGV